MPQAVTSNLIFMIIKRQEKSLHKLKSGTISIKGYKALMNVNFDNKLKHRK